MNHFFKNRFLKKAAVYKEMKHFFVLIITLTIHGKKTIFNTLKDWIFLWPKKVSFLF